MHDSSGDESAWILSPFNSRKMHTSRRDAFRPINRMPVARINYRKKFIAFENKYEQRNKEKKPSAKYFDEHIKVGIIKTHPNMYADEFEAYKSFDGLVVEGTGLGHFPSTKVDDFTAENRRIFHAVEQLIQNNVVVVMAPQTIYGRLQMNVYAPQREIQRIGVLGHLSDMTVETTFIKLAFLLSNYPRDEVKKMMMENLKGELSGRVTFNEFLV
jgi:glutamyl-tRNA(Gln) amidotransferase subunit D